jgi:hypothetical protein
MRTISLLAISLALLSSATHAQQQTPATLGDSIGSPSPLLGTPVIQDGPDTVAPDGLSTKKVRAVPCTTAARGTDGTTTCIGIPEESAKKKRR